MKTIVKLFEAQVDKTPDNIAVQFGQVDLTYTQLNQRANQLANLLQKLGVGKEHLVGLFMERSMEMVIGILGILKAGGAYVPIEPDYPLARIGFMLEETRVQIVLGQSNLMNKLSVIQDWEMLSHNLKVICLDSEWNEISQMNSENPVIGAAPENLAYTIFTSGSTGEPKGVMNEHRGVYNRLVWMRDSIPLNEDDRVLQKTPYSFDISIWEIFWPLLSGARLIVAKPGGHKDSDYIVRLIIEQGITAIQFVPSMLQVFLLNNEIEKCRSLRRVICGGEALPFNLQERLFSLLDVEMYNLYGPTEASIGVTCWPCDRESELSTVPIGWPLPNTQIYLLDTQQKPVPTGEHGELHIGGVQVSRGYLNRPDLTAERFIPDPFSDDPTACLYKTGDLARQLSDGSFAYLGRIDYQVKIRGNRVELGEIEATLVQHPSTREAIVVAHEDSLENKRLAAYIVPHKNHKIMNTELREYLSVKLPDYMVPATFTVLDSLPLTSNGKVDRKALPVPTRVRTEISASYVAPRSKVEETLVDLWEQVIGMEGIGIHDNFLELGGDSIQSIQISSRANHAGLRLAPNQILEYQTIAELAEVAGTGPTVLAEQDTITGTLPLTPVQKRFFELNHPRPERISLARLYKVQNQLEKSILEQVIREMLIHHDALRMRFRFNEIAWEQETSAPEEAVPFTYVNLSSLSTTEQIEALHSTKAELQDSLDLSDGPIIRFAYIDLGPAVQSYLLFITHPLVVDGFSWGILLEHLELAYEQLSHNQNVHLPPKTTSFKHWALRLREFSKSDNLKEELSLWTERLENEPTSLPIDVRNGADVQGEPLSESVTLSLGVEDTHALLTQVPKAYQTMVTDVLLSSLAESFYRWTGNPRLLVDIEGHGRELIFEDVDLSQTIGCFSAIYPVLLDVGDSSGPGEFLMSIKEQLRGVPNGGIGYGVMRYLREEDELHQMLEDLPQAQLSFHYSGQIDHLLASSSIFSNTRNFVEFAHHFLGDPHYLMKITAGIIEDQLHLNWIYSRHAYQQKTIEKFTRVFMDTLVEIIEHCKAVGVGRYTPSDFPEANLNQQELDALLAEINENED